MATWDNATSVQGAASGAAIGSAIPGIGTAIGAGVGFLAGGILGGLSSDAARRAEERRREEIQRAIDRQNQSTFQAKRSAEQWALADLGVGSQDQYQQAVADQDMYQGILSNTQQAYDKSISTIDRYEDIAEGRRNRPDRKIGTGGLRTNNSGIAMVYQYRADKLSAELPQLQRNIQLAQGQVNMNQGILSNFDLASDRKY